MKSAKNKTCLTAIRFVRKIRNGKKLDVRCWMLDVVAVHDFKLLTSNFKRLFKIRHLFTAYCLPIVIGMSTAPCLSQAYQFTQFYAYPTFLNPAFTGTGVCGRLTSGYRIQWPSIPGAFRTYLIAFDHSIPKKNSGIGFLFLNDQAGSGNLRSASFNAQYSYQLILTRKWAFNAGAEAGYVTRNYDFNKFIFGDMIAYGTSASVTQPIYDKIHYLDLSSGVLLYSETTWLGFSARHINQPNQALVSEESRLPVLYSVHLGTSFALDVKGDAAKKFSRHRISPAIHYRAGKKFDQVDIGFYYSYMQFVLGVWYRGIPLLKSYKPGYPNNDAVAVVAGITDKRFKFGYSYDITISWLSGNTAGSHEVSLSYQFCNPLKVSRKSAIPCPKF